MFYFQGRKTVTDIPTTVQTKTKTEVDSMLLTFISKTILPPLKNTKELIVYLSLKFIYNLRFKGKFIWQPNFNCLTLFYFKEIISTITGLQTEVETQVGTITKDVDDVIIIIYYYYLYYIFHYFKFRLILDINCQNWVFFYFSLWYKLQFFYLSAIFWISTLYLKTYSIFFAGYYNSTGNLERLWKIFWYNWW